MADSLIGLGFYNLSRIDFAMHFHSDHKRIENTQDFLWYRKFCDFRVF